jgi:nicotinamidase-related amidase
MLPRLTPDNCLLLIVDVQTRLLPEMWDAQRVERNLVLLTTLARRLKIPTVVSEQNPTRIGSTVDAVREALGDYEPISKMRFSAWPDAQPQLEGSGRKTVLLTGLEAHICITQTALDLIDNGYTVFGVYDAISSRQNWNRKVGWERLKGAGVIPSSTESAIYELLGEAGTDDFRAMLPLVK